MVVARAGATRPPGGAAEAASRGGVACRDGTRCGGGGAAAARALTLFDAAVRPGPDRASESRLRGAPGAFRVTNRARGRADRAWRAAQGGARARGARPRSG